jgi:hypothetical protein
MSIFNFLRRPAARSPATQTQSAQPAQPAPVGEPAAPVVAPGLTVELKLRGRRGGGEQEPGLEAAENRLAELQTMYRLGEYSGRPEEMLEDIEFAEKAVQRLRGETTVLPPSAEHPRTNPCAGVFSTL